MWWLVGLRVSIAADLSALRPDAMADAICLQTNRVRVMHGLPALKVRPMLHAGAQLHAEQMVDHDFFGHTAPAEADFTAPTDRMQAAGIANPFPAENIATWYALKYYGTGYRTIDAERAIFRSEGRTLKAQTPESFAVDIVAYWMSSPPHRANLLSPYAIEIGCGSALYANGGFPMVKGVQLFQLHEPVTTDSGADDQGTLEGPGDGVGHQPLQRQPEDGTPNRPP